MNKFDYDATKEHHQNEDAESGESFGEMLDSADVSPEVD